jgi:general secretion pathway protein A
MYQEFFGLQRLPFNLTPDPAFLYLPAKHHEALAGLSYAVMERKGFVVLSGDAGTGKTTLLRSFLNDLPPDKVQSSVILNPTLTASEFLETVLLDFGIADVPQSKAQRLWKLQDFLLQAFREKKIAVLVIDEAHKLSLDVLEEIRLLGNLEHEQYKFLQIVLSGQCELDDLLNRQDLRQFKQRIALRLYIDPLSPLDVSGYLRSRWSIASGRDATPFTPEAVDGLVLWSRGIPRLINSLADGALMIAYGDGSKSVGIKNIETVAMNLALTAPAESSPRVPPPTTMPLSLPEVEVRPKPAPVASSAAFNHVAEQKPTPRAIYDLASPDSRRSNLSLLKRLAGKLGFPSES